MTTVILTWALLAGAIAMAVAGALWWRRQQRRRAAAARRVAAAQAELAAQRAARQANEQTAAALHAAARLRADQATRAQAERAARQRAEAERAAVAGQVASAALARAAGLRRVAVQAAAPAAPRRPSDILVMVADDSKVVRVKTSRLLVQHGYRVVLAEDGTQAAELLEAELPAVLVTDVEMPGMDGLELTRHVRAHPRASQIPIIMITSADGRLKAAAAAAGVTLVLGKPYPEDELIACIERSQATATA